MRNCKSCWISMCTPKSKAKAQVQDKERHKSRFFDCYSTFWNHSIATRFLFDLLKISKSTKMSKIWKCPQLVLFKPNSWFVCCNKGHYKLSLESYIKRKREVPNVPPILYLGFLHPKFSHIFDRWYSLKQILIQFWRSKPSRVVLKLWTGGSRWNTSISKMSVDLRV